MATSTDAKAPRLRSPKQRWAGDVVVRLVPAIVLLIGWHFWAEAVGSMMIAGPIETIQAVISLFGDPQLWRALRISNTALVIGFGISILIGLPMGLLMGRFRAFERMADVWVNVTLITPMAMVLPVVIMAFGFSLAARSFIVLMFCLPMVVVNSRAGVHSVDARLLEMATFFGASERQKWRHILIPGASPAIWAGVRIAIGRGVSGTILVEMLLVGVGVGEMLLRFRGLFQAPKLFAIVVIVIMQALLLVSIAKYIERKATPWANTGFVTKA